MLGMLVAGIVLVAAGIALLVAVQPATAKKLSRLAGLLIVVGCALAGLAIYESVTSLASR